MIRLLQIPVMGWKFLQLSESVENVANIWFKILLFTIIFTFIISELTKNYSQVDKIWSILPIVYSFVVLVNFSTSARIVLMTTLVTVWGIRLSYNFYRKGGYNMLIWKGEEDYRWSILRQQPLLKGIRFSIFNLLFISVYQLALITFFCTPLLLAAKYTDVPLNILDYIASLFMLVFISIETLSDNQLYSFHQQKQKKIPQSGQFSVSLEKGFMQEGFWKYVRHPNFISEQLIWVSFYFFGVAASGEWLNWTVGGAILLVLLFQGSAAFTESISSKKYPEYIQYKAVVPKFFPFVFRSDKAKD